AGMRWGEHMVYCWYSLVAMLQVKTVNDILTLASQIKETTEFLEQPDFFRPELKTPFHLELESIGYLRRSLTTDRLPMRVAFLSKALEALQGAQSHTESHIASPEGDVLLTALMGWEKLFREQLDMLQGTAQLRLDFQSLEIQHQEEITLSAALTNEGLAYAEALTIELLPNEGYIPATDPVSPAALELLPSSDSQALSFRLQLDSEDRFIVQIRVRYRDTQEEERLFTEQISIMEYTQGFTDFHNPYQIGRSIQEKDSQVFYGRSDVFRDIAQILDENRQKSNGKSLILLVGERRLGKTSVLQQLDYQLLGHYIPVFLDVQGFNDPGDAAFLFWLGVRIQRQLRRIEIMVERPSLQALQEAPTTLFELFLTDDVLPQLADRHLLLLFDEFEHMHDLIQEGKQSEGILLFLRNLMQHVPKLSFVFAGTQILQQIASEYQSIMFNIAQTIKLNYLSKPDTKQLVTTPVADVLTYEPGAVDYTYRLTHGHPFFTQLLCYEMVERQRKQRKAYTTITDVEDAVRHIIDTGHDHFTFIFETLSPPERLVLSVVAAWSAERRTVLASDVVSELSRYRTELSVYDAARQLERLAQRELLVADMRSNNSVYTFRMELVRRWLVQHRPLGEVLSQPSSRFS
ncbi:AAA family ATPase, partial [Candidatus Entotheonella palauensis]|uniref:AAA family ATPase n=1 Tax=Candidatus Entotheonella palauensis TaxID=93172 RepID=UPI0011779081